MKKLKYLIYIILLLGFDQFTKYLAATNLKEGGPFQIIPKVLQLYYHENDGAVWGIMSGRTGILIGLTFLIMGGMIYFFFKIPTDKKYNYLRVVLLFITAGAVGNLIDRIVNKYVVDFIYFEIIDFPIFNVADCYITISSILLILLSLFYYKDEDYAFLSKKNNKNENMNE